jgi:hypothetical protein
MEIQWAIQPVTRLGMLQYRGRVWDKTTRRVLFSVIRFSEEGAKSEVIRWISARKPEQE